MKFNALGVRSYAIAYSIIQKYQRDHIDDMDDKGISNPRVIMNSAEHILVDKYLVLTYF